MAPKEPRQLKELRNLLPFAWDAHIDKHPPGEAAMRDFQNCFRWQSGTPSRRTPGEAKPPPKALAYSRKRQKQDEAENERPSGSPHLKCERIVGHRSFHPESLSRKQAAATPAQSHTAHGTTSATQADASVATPATCKMRGSHGQTQSCAHTGKSSMTVVEWAGFASPATPASSPLAVMQPFSAVAAPQAAPPRPAPAQDAPGLMDCGHTPPTAQQGQHSSPLQPLATGQGCCPSRTPACQRDYGTTRIEAIPHAAVTHGAVGSALAPPTNPKCSEPQLQEQTSPLPSSMSYKATMGPAAALRTPHKFQTTPTAMSSARAIGPVSPAPPSLQAAPLTPGPLRGMCVPLGFAAQQINLWTPPAPASALEPLPSAPAPPPPAPMGTLAQPAAGQHSKAAPSQPSGTQSLGSRSLTRLLSGRQPGHAGLQPIKRLVAQVANPEDSSTAATANATDATASRPPSSCVAPSSASSPAARKFGGRRDITLPLQDLAAECSEVGNGLFSGSAHAESQASAEAAACTHAAAQQPIATACTVPFAAGNTHTHRPPDAARGGEGAVLHLSAVPVGQRAGRLEGAEAASKLDYSARPQGMGVLPILSLQVACAHPHLPGAGNPIAAKCCPGSSGCGAALVADALACALPLQAAPAATIAGDKDEGAMAGGVLQPCAPYSLVAPAARHACSPPPIVQALPPVRAAPIVHLPLPAATSGAIWAAPIVRLPLPPAPSGVGAAAAGVVGAPAPRPRPKSAGSSGGCPPLFHTVPLKHKAHCSRLPPLGPRPAGLQPGSFAAAVSLLAGRHLKSTPVRGAARHSSRTCGQPNLGAGSQEALPPAPCLSQALLRACDHLRAREAYAGWGG